MSADWLGQIPAFLVACALLTLPGLPSALLLRLRGVTALGGAIVLSLASVGAATLLAPVLGLRWSLLPVLIAAAAITVVAAALWFVRRSAVQPLGGGAGRSVWLGVGVGALGWILILIVGMSGAGHPSQLFDGLFHLNAVEFVMENGDASPFHMTMVMPGVASTFYPTLWHALVSLVVPFSSGIVPATNVMTIAAIAVVWPVALATLTNVLFARYRAAAAWAPLVAFGFSVFPLGFLNWGVLYPNLIGTLQIPLLLAFVVLACRPGLTWGQRTGLVLTAIAAMGATALGHPSALLGAIALLVPFAVWGAWRVAKAGSTRTRVLVVIAVAVATVALVAVWRLANVTTHEWLPGSTLGAALGEVAFLSPVGRATGLLVGPLAFVGIWTVAKSRRWWILGSYGVAIILFLVSTSLSILGLRSALVGIWYDDTTRVAALLGVLGVPLAALGAAVVWSWIRTQWKQRRSVRAVAVVVLGVLLAATHLSALVNDLRYMRNVSFRFDAHSQGLSADEAELFAEASSLLGPDALVLGDPLTGAALLYAYTGHDVVFPHVTGRYDADALLLARSLNTASTEVCSSIDRLGVTHVLDFGDRQLYENHYVTYNGLHDLAGSPILTEVASVGDSAALYQVTGCP
ncbi:conserved membrane protein of unknown function [Microbacterium sp. Nx66]|uniref:DUF6541 family protein n=1 Tax=Microbacterium sp. Nx66 TaxID=2766784 RepID=UPI0016571BD2|nr:DUF6541 family protein [Microbacterium sp. Nx66]CAD5138680.1 conserved membrane protein of unknown function [Microbacterium sp. Nx66]